MAALYSFGFWIRKEKAIVLSNLMFRFLAGYACCASITLLQHKRRFPMVPKVHMIAHTALDLWVQSQMADWVENPIAYTNQSQEDFIGRPARISRRVNIRSIHRSVLFRSLIVYQESLSRADSDQRGLDGYSDLWYMATQGSLKLSMPILILQYSLWFSIHKSFHSWDHRRLGGNVVPKGTLGEEWPQWKKLRGGAGWLPSIYVFWVKPQIEE